MNYVLVLLSAIILSSCGTLFSPSADEISFTSIPAGAKVYKGSELLGVTPFKKSFKRDTFANITLKVMKDGHETKEVRIHKTLNKVAIFNLTSWLSWGTDALTGKMIEYSPNSYLIELTSSAKKTSFLERETIKFVAANRANLMTSIARGRGEPLENLFKLYEIKRDDEDQVRKELKINLRALMAKDEPVSMGRAFHGLLSKYNRPAQLISDLGSSR